ncbi:hypothetical protein AAFC00_005521 [Neodothiora populina]|uniref:beta-glucosidase n=1 Tax=Neodothiora populina TaxID=2781224 RepID=A0ABR3PL51_9PEZI
MVQFNGKLLAVACLSACVLAEDLNASSAVEWRTSSARVNALIEQLTGEEKVTLVTGHLNPGNQNQAGYVAPVPRSNIPAVQLSDGEAGINVVVNAIAPPNQLNIAATWSKAAAYNDGVITGRDAALLNMTVALAPRVNILRDPVEGNLWQSYSEDPFLNGALGVAAMNGIQSQGTMANSKQIGPSSTGASSGDLNSIVDLQTPYEVYWAPHGELIDAGVATLMCSYSKVNGVQACQYQEISNFVRSVHNFTGIMMSDWGATHSTAPSIEASMDWEMPFGTFYGQALYNDIYTYGNLSETYLDRAVGHILQTYEAYGLLDKTATSMLLDTGSLSADVETTDANLAYDIAVRSGILLKNKGALPISNDASIAVIGPNGLQYTSGTNFAERAFGCPDRRISSLVALEQRKGGASIPSAVGIDLEGTVIPSSALISLNGTSGLSRNDSFGFTVIDQEVDSDGLDQLPANRSYTWQGFIRTNTSGLYRLSLQREFSLLNNGNNNSDYHNIFSVGSLGVNGSRIANGYRIFGDGGIRPWSYSITTRAGWDNIAATVYLSAGVHNISFGIVGVIQQPASVRLCWVTPEQREADITTAVDLAKTVDTPIVFAFAQSPAAQALTLDAYMDELVT